jgi:hypothetical protein
MKNYLLTWTDFLFGLKNSRFATCTFIDKKGVVQIYAVVLSYSQPPRPQL